MACPPRDAFQIGWISALPIEAAAAAEMLDENLGILQEQDAADIARLIYWVRRGKEGRGFTVG